MRARTLDNGQTGGGKVRLIDRGLPDLPRTRWWFWKRSAEEEQASWSPPLLLLLFPGRIGTVEVERTRPRVKESVRPFGQLARLGHWPTRPPLTLLRCSVTGVDEMLPSRVFFIF